MKKRILFNVRPYQTRVAYVENEVLKDLFYHRKEEPSLVGGIYKGKVVRSVRGLNFIFMDLGFKRSAFLYKKKSSHRSAYKEGDELLVQVISDSIYEKGQRLSADISLSSRFLAYIPQQKKKVSVSRRISNEKERDRLSDLIKSLDEEGTFIVRTLAENQSEKEIKKDVKKLKKTWAQIQKQFEKKQGVGEIQKSLSPDLDYLKDFMNASIDEIIVDQKEAFSQIKKFIKSSMPEFVPRLKLFSKDEILFEAFHLESQIKVAQSRRVRFKGGGFLIFEELETLSVIDVNTGRYMGKKNPEETILNTNLEAARTVAKQIRLRQLGGIIVIDFIDMEDLKAREKVVSVLEKEFESDKAYPRVFPMSELALVQITRKRSRSSLFFSSTQACPSCKGEGRVLSPTGALSEFFIALEKKARKKSKKKQKLSVLCHPEAHNQIKSQQKKTLDFFKKELSLELEFSQESSFSPGSFKIKDY